MQCMYRKAKPGDVVETWEGIEFVSAIAKTVADVDEMIADGWVAHPHDLDKAEQPKRRGRPPKE